MQLDALVPMLAGGIAVPLVNWLKVALGLEGKAAFVLTLIVSALLGLVAVLWTGGFDGGNLLSNIAVVFSVASSIYKLAQ